MAQRPCGKDAEAEAEEQQQQHTAGAFAAMDVLLRVVRCMELAHRCVGGGKEPSQSEVEEGGDVTSRQAEAAHSG